jgi:hypothetical protein
MNTAAADFQADFMRALFAPVDAAPGALAALTAQPAFAVYRNTVMKGCVDALEANFPSVARLVGRDWFRAAAALYAAAQPPADARLLCYGDSFPEFLARFEPARALPYLPDVARLDRCWSESHAAADADAEDAATRLASLPPLVLGATRIAPHPAARWRWFPGQPIYSIWHRNRSQGADADDGDDADIVWQGEGALLTRPAAAVTSRATGRADCAFLDACAGGAPVAEAAAAALEVQPDADLAALFAGLLRDGALILESPPGDLP